MSKLDDILNNLQMNMNGVVKYAEPAAIKQQVDSLNHASQQIKDLMHEIIGDYEEDIGMAKPHLTKRAKWNQLKDIQHQEVNKL